jgi:hypothetical protein
LPRSKVASVALITRAPSHFTVDDLPCAVAALPKNWLAG